MARGDVTVFNEFLKDLGVGTHTLGTDTLRVALVDDTITPTAADTSPTWGDYSANEVSGTGYTAGGEEITTDTWTTTGAVTSLAGDDVVWTMNAGGPTDAYWAIIYNDTAASDEAIGFVDLAGPVSLQAGDISIEWTDGVVLSLTANA